MMSNEEIAKCVQLQDELIKRSCTEFNTKTSMLLMSAARVIGLLVEEVKPKVEEDK